VGVHGLTGFILCEQLQGLPQPSASPEPSPSVTPEASESPEASATPEVSESPEASATPEVSEPPEPSATPEASESPEATTSATPAVTLPMLTIAPGSTQEIEATAVPTATPEPTATATPEPTAELPELTAAPVSTQTPAPTAVLPELTQAPEATATPKPTATATPRPTATPKPAEPLPQPTVMDRPMPTQVPAPEGAQGMLVVNDTMYAYVNVSETSSLTVRKSASTSAAPLTYLYRGTQVRLVAFNDDWAYIRTASGTSGFASRKYLYLPGNDAGSQPVAQDKPKQEEEDLKDVQDSAEEELRKFREVDTGITFCSINARTTAQVKMYESYSTSSDVIGTLPASAKLKVSAYNSKWAYVRFGSRKGFVQKKYLKAE